MRRSRLVIFVKEPAAGRVKTRLGRGVGMAAAAWWFRHASRALIRRMTADPRWQTVLAVAPDREGMASRFWPSGVPRRPQGRGDLGARMARAFRDSPPGPVAILGADIPAVRAAHVAAAFRALGDHDAVFGPAPDGGYWLIGLRRAPGPPPRGLFEGVRWSTEHALADTIATLPRGARVAFLETLADVDDAHDLETARAATGA